MTPEERYAMSKHASSEIHSRSSFWLSDTQECESGFTCSSQPSRVVNLATKLLVIALIV